MNVPFKDKKKDFDDEQDEIDDDFAENWSSDSDENDDDHIRITDDEEEEVDDDEEEEDEDDEPQLIIAETRRVRPTRPARSARTTRTARLAREVRDDENSRRLRPPKPFKSHYIVPPVPPMPPMPPMPPLPTDFEVIKSDKVIGIRGLDKRLYKDISAIAKKNGVSVAELLNRLLAKYRFDSVSENGNTISNVSTLDLYEEELAALADEKINLVDIKTLRFGPDITIETFSKVNKIEGIRKIWVPSHLYLLVLKKAKHCDNIEKYRGDHLPLVLQKSFDSDVHLSRTFFDYFLDTGEMVDLTVYGELRIDMDITLEDFKNVIYSLYVDNDIHAPRHLIGFIYAKAKCYGEIEEIDD
jgi:hypothetical protein